MRNVFTFPDPVNEVSARLVASGVVALTVTYLSTRSSWVLAALAYGFVARVLSGPTLSPLGQFVTRVATPRLGVAERLVPGPPKRFAQGIGATLSVLALASQLAGSTTTAVALVAMITVAASLEAFVGFCLGCTIFGYLIRAGVVPETACEACNDVSARVSLDG